MKTMNIALVVLVVLIVSFTSVMIWLYMTTGAIPDTLCACFFTACGGECGFMAWIKSAKEKYKNRQWEIEDKKEFQNKENNYKEE